MTGYILALDQGTSSSRSVIFDAEGKWLFSAQREFKQYFPKLGWVEHDPMEIWNTQITTAREVLKQANIRPNQIKGIGVANQRETTLVWERKTGQAIYPAIVWQDRRTLNECALLREKISEEKIHTKTGLRLDPYFSATKIAWILEHVPGAREKAERGELAFGTVDTWLVWNLTQGQLHVTDKTNASRTLLWNIRTEDWDDDLLNLFHIPRIMLPDVKPSSCMFGMTEKSVFGDSIMIGGIAGDQQAALFGQVCVTPGKAKNTYGTGCFVLQHTGGACVESRHGLLSTVVADHQEGVQYALEGSVFTGGSVVQWLRDGLGIIKKSSEVEKLANSVPDSGGVLFVPALTGLGAPYWKPEAKGAIFGITRGTTAAHIARAAVESIAFQSTVLLRVMAKDALIPVTQLRVDGGAAANDSLLQFQADLLGIPVIRPEVIETTVLGAAYLAGLAVGVYEDMEVLMQKWKINKTFLPQMSQDQAHKLMQEWDRAVARSF
jgi:glycerol kinase